MSKRYISSLFFLLLFCILMHPFASAAELVGLKNLSWEEQKNKTRIILETSKPLQYNVIASQTATEIQVELSNLDLRNLPQELFINTDEVVSLQTFPQSGNQKARIVIRLNSYRPHQVTAEGNKLFVDVEGNPDGGTLLEPVTQVKVPQPKEEEKLDPRVEEMNKLVKEAEAANKQAAASTVQPQVPPEPKQAESAPELPPATQISDIRIDPIDTDVVDVVLVGDGSFRYDVFELTNPHRLVIDLRSVTMAPTVQSMLAGGDEMVSRIRVAQYQVSPKVVRAVIDLSKKVPYTVIPEGKELRIHLGEQTEVPAADSNGSAETEQREERAVSSLAPSKNETSSNQVVESLFMKSPKVEAVKPAEISNEQFFAFQPDTSLFAQETGTGTASTTPPSTTTPPPPPPPSTAAPTGQGVGRFEERTLTGGQKQYTGEPFSFDFKDIDIKDLFRFIADISGLNVILDPAVKGSVTLKLTDVPWDQALDLITKNEGLGYTIEGNVIRIAPLSKIAAEERARVDAHKQQMLSAPLVTKIKPLSYAKASEVDRVVKRLLTAKGSSIIDPRTNTLIITEIDTHIDPIMNLIETLDSRTTQVVIEARIVETTKNFAQSFGIQWGFRGIVDPAFGNNTTLQFPNNILVGGNNLVATSGVSGNPLGGYAVNLPVSGANSAILLSAGNILDTFRLDLALTALETTGNGRILSSPKVATQNNNRAEILQGTQIPVQTIANNTITTTFVNAALRMSVLPQITAEGTIIMDVDVENNRPDFANVSFSGTPPIITERASTTLLVEDGGTTVIGGIFTASDDYAQSRTPILHRIPLLGWLFKNQNVTRQNRELLIFLTPRIMR